MYKVVQMPHIFVVLWANGNMSLSLTQIFASITVQTTHRTVFLYALADELHGGRD